MSGRYASSSKVVSRNRSRGGVAGYIRLARPFTLIAPALGMVSGALVAYYASGTLLVHGYEFLGVLLLGTFAGALLNAASNSLNQIFDLDIDRVNKPVRPLCTGEVSVVGAAVFTGVTAASALILAGVVSVITGHWGTLAMFLAASVFSVMYSVPPVRMKSRAWWANLTIALPRGTLLKVAGWSLAQSIVSTEAWYIGLIMGLFLVGATTTKDFADIRGDKAFGVMTLPATLGPKKAARRIAPFLVFPFALIPIGGWLGILTPPPGRQIDLVMLGVISMLWGAHVAARIAGDPESLTRTENHPAWRHMYYLMIFLQVGFILAYVPYTEYARLIQEVL